MDKIWSERELEEEFGILPGEKDDKDVELGMEVDMQVEEGLMWEGRCLEDMLDGYCVGGV